MTRHDAAVLTLRAFAIYAWFQALEYLAAGSLALLMTFLVPMDHGPFGAKMVAIFVPFVLLLALGVFLFVRSREIAWWLLPAPNQADAEQAPLDTSAAASVAFAVVGAAIFLYAMPQVFASAFFFATLADAAARAQQWTRQGPTLLGAALQLVLGFVLFLKARTFASAWWRRQQPGSGLPPGGAGNFPAPARGIRPSDPF